MRRRSAAVAAGLVLATAPLAFAGHASTAKYCHGIGCSVTTGFAAAESHVDVLPDGTLVYTPAVVPQGVLGIGEVPGDQFVAQSNASPAALAVSHDGGAHWSLMKPSGVTWNPNDHADYVDPVTGRLFFEDFGPIPTVPAFGRDQEGPAQVNVSPDGGRTWSRTVLEDTVFPENAQFTSAPPPPGGDRPVHYPRISYFCANITIGFTSPLIAQRSCYRSLDGGLTWATRSTILRSSVPIHSECTPYGESISALDGHYPQPGPHGSLYLLISCGPNTFLAKSTDEALTFPVMKTGEGPRTIPIPAAPNPDFNSAALQVLGDGTLVVITLQNGRLSEITSKNEGRTWTAPRDINAPGVAKVGTWSVSSRGQRTAVAYYGQHANDTKWYGYVGLLRGSSVVSGQISPDPLLFGSSATGGPGVMGAGGIPGPGGTNVPFPPPLDNHSTGNDFLGAAVGPDGTPYGSFQRDCGPSSSSSGCVANGGQTRGIVGWLRLT